MNLWSMPICSGLVMRIELSLIFSHSPFLSCSSILWVYFPYTSYDFIIICLCSACLLFYFSTSVFWLSVIAILISTLVLQVGQVFRAEFSEHLQEEMASCILINITKNLNDKPVKATPTFSQVVKASKPPCH